ncbi:MAG: GDP-mannose 4,6-dehydratase [Candidatus Competibacteraceae bacterium]|nr:GDP-mannose 4,6-dehydratase [Candidatus Competibacteraceae bacterium]
MNFWPKRRVLVTGATGLLGGWLTAELIQRGADVVVLVRDRIPACMFFRDGLDRKVSLVSGSLEDAGLLRRLMAEYEVETVFHLAAQTIVGVAKKDPVSTLKANVEGTWNLLDAMRQYPTAQVLIASSDKAYGNADSLPYTEEHPLKGEYPYDVSKSCTDLIARMYAMTYGVPVGIMRCGNLFGGGDLNFSRTIPGVILATSRGKRFEIRSDGLFIRDFLYVEDAVDGYLCLAEKLASDSSLTGEAFNLSLGLQLTVLDVTRKVLELMGRVDLEPIILNQASAEIRQQYLSAEKARCRLGWTPRIGMDEGLKRTIDWYRQHFQAVT